MNYKQKLLILAFITALSSESFSLDSGEFMLTAVGSKITQEIDGTLEIESQDHNLDDGQTELIKAVGASDGGTIYNTKYGEIIRGEQTYLSRFGGVLGGGVTNSLKKTDTLVVLESEKNGNVSKLINDGLIEAGKVKHDTEIIIEIAAIGEYIFSNYNKNVITSTNSEIENNGQIISDGDEFNLTKGLQISALNVKKASYNKNVVNMSGGKLINNKEITMGRDLEPGGFSVISAELLSGGFQYRRDVVAGINAKNSVIENTGTISVLGDLGRKESFSGIEANLLGADLTGTHNKYGILADGGKITNKGTIEIERDYTYKLADDGSIIEVGIGAGSILELGVLSFSNMKEKSIGVSVSNGAEFINENGTIKVGSNQDKGGISTSTSSAVAVQSDNSSTTFKGDNNKIELTGTNVYISDLKNNSVMTFDGTTTVDYTINNDKVNRKLFNNDSSSKHIINGKLKINGDFTIGEGNNIENSGNIESENLKIQKGSNYIVNGKIDEDGNLKVGVLETSGELNLEGDIKISGDMLVGKSEEELSKIYGQTIVKAGGGITGDGVVIGGSYLFDVASTISSEKGRDENSTGKDDSAEIITIDNIERKSFTDIVENRELAEILERNYSNSTLQEREFYKLLASAENKKDFEKTVSDATGEKNINNLSFQVYSITDELNREFKNFAKTNTGDGVNFKYINSSSSADMTSTADGFDRDSNGIILNYSKVLGDNSNAGLSFAYVDSNISYDSNSSRNDIKSWNIRGYYLKDFNFASVLSDLSFGYNTSENKRMGATEMLEGEADLYVFGFNNVLYKEYKLNDKFSLTPAINFDFTYIMQDEYRENGKTEAITLDKSNSFFVKGGIELNGEYKIFSFKKSNLNFVGGIEYSYNFIDEADDLKEKVNIIDDDSWFTIKSRKIDKNSLAYNIGLVYQYNDAYNFTAFYSKELINNVENDKFTVDFSYHF